MSTPHYYNFWLVETSKEKVANIMDENSMHNNVNITDYVSNSLTHLVPQTKPEHATYQTRNEPRPIFNLIGLPSVLCIC